MGRVREGWYEGRTEEKRISLDYLKSNCNLTKRERELLQLIYDRKLVRRDSLEIISPSYRKAGNNRTTLLNRAIKKMYRHQILDKIHEVQEIGRGNTPCIVGIDKGGSILLGVPHKPRIAQKKTFVRDKCYVTRFLPSNFRHIHGVNQLEVKTILFCEDTGSKILMWKHEVATNFVYNGENILFIPDSLYVLEINGKPFPIFLEFDTGSEGLREKEPKVILNKIINYRRYKASRLWLEEEWQKSLHKPMFPLLLFVTEDYKRIQFFNNKSKENGVWAYGVYHENYYDFMKEIATLVK